MYFITCYLYHAVYSALGYKHAVQVFYVKNLAEACLEAQQDCRYPLHGDMSIVMVLPVVFEGRFVYPT